ncbi:uncharacterized protein V6R79_011542 [Siganus canaliculatus]
MAVYRRRLGRESYDFANTIFGRHVLKNHKKQGKSAIQASSLSVGFLWGDIQNSELCGVENTAGRVTGFAQDSYTRVTPLFTSVHGQGNKPGHGLRLNKEHSSSKKAQDQTTERGIRMFRSFDKTRRTFCTLNRLQSIRTLCCGQFVFIRAYASNGTQSEPLYKTKTGYYDILEVTPSATQTQIKTAYYKQSFIYHPDRNAGSDGATLRFSEISEAYTVLGNKALRRKYDRGLLSQYDLVATAKPSGKDSSGGSSKQQTDRQRSVMGTDRRGGVYDFDKFFRAHYSEQLQREKDIRVRKEEMLKKKEETIAEMKMGRVMEIGVGLILAMAVTLLFSVKT